MANLKGITVEIGGDTTKLTSALQGVNKEIKSTQPWLLPLCICGRQTKNSETRSRRSGKGSKQSSRPLRKELLTGSMPSALISRTSRKF